MIRDEAFAIMRAPGGVPTLAEVSPDHGRIALGGWRSFFLRAYDYPVPANMQRCPGTSAALAKIPTLNSAFFSILAPGASIPEHRGPTKGIITCHLTLQTPSFDDCRLRIGGREVGWTEGEFLILDDSYRHEVSNNSDVTKVVLLIQVRRPSRWPGRMLIAPVPLGHPAQPLRPGGAAQPHRLGYSPGTGRGGRLTLGLDFPPPSRHGRRA